MALFFFAFLFPLRVIYRVTSLDPWPRSHKPIKSAASAPLLTHHNNTTTTTTTPIYALNPRKSYLLTLLMYRNSISNFLLLNFLIRKYLNIYYYIGSFGWSSIQLKKTAAELCTSLHNKEEVKIMHIASTHQSTQKVVIIASSKMNVFDVLDDDFRCQSGAAVQHNKLPPVSWKKKQI